MEAQPPKGHWNESTGAPLEAMHTRWVVCTPWPHVTEHEVLALTQLYVKTGVPAAGGRMTLPKHHLAPGWTIPGVAVDLAHHHLS